ETFERLCLGQLRETVGPPHGADPIEHYLEVLADKTGSLIATSARFGAMFGGCESAIVRQVSDFGEKAGVAFQLADDVIDLRSTGKATGKTPGTDLRERVATMPVLLLRRRVAEGGDRADAELLGCIDGELSDDAALGDVVAALAAHDVAEETVALALEWAGRAKVALADLPGGSVAEALVGFADHLVARVA
ncbi:MAG: polyprenyl synthetase family protein, partial [Demequinaceae bacterium]|nr:polyprenyl synthetase family protein [Demequinaceae bacterium]